MINFKRSLHSILLKYKTFQKEFPTDLANYALQTAKKTRAGNYKDFGKIYWFTQYQLLMNQPTLFFVQSNCMTGTQSVMFKSELDKLGLMPTLLKNSIFRSSIHESSKTLYELTGNSFYQNEYLKLSSIPVGPTFLVYSASEMDAMNSIKGFASVMKKLFPNAMVVGGKVGELVLTPDSFDRVSSLPSQAELHAQLVGLLSTPASQLVQLLSRTPQLLVQNLEEHSKTLE